MSRHVTRKALTACAISVAMATPATPSPKTRTKTVSRTMLTMQQMIRMYSGLLESPVARRTAEPIL